MDVRERIFDFIEQDDQRAATAVDERIATQVLVLLQFPEGGRPGRVEGTRELVVRRTPYRPRAHQGLSDVPLPPLALVGRCSAGHASGTADWLLVETKSWSTPQARRRTPN
jgi:plasmid stabilization system protein ParE